MTDRPQDDTQQLSLSTATAQLLEESRMVLPGMQALFGFQLIAVFNEGFSTRLDPFEQRVHLLSIGCVLLAIALIMTPAAYHRQRSPLAVSGHFISMSSRLILISMAPLALAICIDFYLIAELILGRTPALVLALSALLVFVGCWFIFPRMPDPTVRAR